MAKKKASRTSIVTAGLGFGVAAGVLFGALVLAPLAPDNDSEAETSASQPGSEEENNAQIEADAVLTQEITAGDKFLAHYATDIIKDQLTDRPIVLLKGPGADDSQVSAVRHVLNDAGAIDAGQIDLAPKFFARSGADELKTIAASTLPAGAQLSTESLDAGTHGADILGAALLLNPESGEPLASTDDRALVLQSLRDAGFLGYPDGTIRPAQGILLIVGEDYDEDEAVVEAASNFAKELAKHGAATVVAANLNSAAEGIVASLRSAETEVSTVDSLDREWAKISIVQAFAELFDGSHGHYGAAENADGPAPALT